MFFSKVTEMRKKIYNTNEQNDHFQDLDYEKTFFKQSKEERDIYCFIFLFFCAATTTTNLLKVYNHSEQHEIEQVHLFDLYRFFRFSSSSLCMYHDAALRALKRQADTLEIYNFATKAICKLEKKRGITNISPAAETLTVQFCLYNIEEDEQESFTYNDNF